MRIFKLTECFSFITSAQFKPNGVSHRNQLHQSISILRVFEWYFYSNFNGISCKQTGDYDQTPHFAASDLGLHCLPLSHKKDATCSLIRVKSFHKLKVLKNLN